MIRTKGEAGTGDVVEAVKHMRTVNAQIARARAIFQSNADPEPELRAFARELEAPYELVRQCAELGRLPVVNFAAGGVATPADAALMILATGAPGADQVRKVLQTIFAQRPGVPIAVETKAKKGKLKPKLIARSEP